MKLKILIGAAVMAFTACTQPKETTDDGYTPEALQLESDIMTPEVLWSFGRVGEISVSPDGDLIAYTVTNISIEDNKGYSDIYLIPTKGGEAVRLTNTKENEFGLQWRPDSKKIGYMSSKSGSVQIWEIDKDGSNREQRSNFTEGISGFKYSPDISKIAYIQSVKLDDDIHDMFPDLPKAEARLEDDIMYRHWDSWHDYRYNHIFVTKYEDSIIDGRDVMEGEKFDSPTKPFDGVEQISWMADSKAIAYSSKKKNGKEYAFSTNTDIYLFSLEDGSTQNLTKGMMGYDKAPNISPDGKWMAWESMERDGYEADKNRIYLLNIETKEKTDLTEGWDQTAHGISWNHDSKSLYAISNYHAKDEIYRFDLDKKITKLTDGVRNLSSVAVAADGQLISGRVSMNSPKEIYRVDAKSGLETKLTTVNKEIQDQLTMGKVEERWIETTDNKKMHVWVIYPPHFDPSKSYPALLYCQGGPQGTVSSNWSYRWNFQMMAANGYIIVAPNRRGLPGFGCEWNEQISGDYGGQNMDDYLSAIDEVAKEPFVDENRLGAVGASYGGFSTYYLAGHHEKRFKTFISHCGIFNFDQMYLTTEEMFFVDWEFGGAPWEKDNPTAMQSYDKFSPHKYIGKWDTPILVIHGAKDLRIPYTQGMGAFNAAVMRDIPAQFLYFPNENHWVLKAQNGILWQRVFFNWLDKYLK